MSAAPVYISIWEQVASRQFYFAEIVDGGLKKNEEATSLGFSRCLKPKI
jgi:hypothetical protein